MGSSSDTSAIQERPKGLQMVLPAKAENVAVIRHALAGLAEEIGMDEPGLADLKTVVTEACMNVVVHAYQGQPGPLSVEAKPDADGLTVTVRDEGAGIRPQAERRARQPAPGPLADRRALEQLLDRRRPRPRHRDHDAGAAAGVARTAAAIQSR